MAQPQHSPNDRHTDARPLKREIIAGIIGVLAAYILMQGTNVISGWMNREVHVSTLEKQIGDIVRSIASIQTLVSENNNRFDKFSEKVTRDLLDFKDQMRLENQRFMSDIRREAKADYGRLDDRLRSIETELTRNQISTDQVAELKTQISNLSSQVQDIRDKMHWLHEPGRDQDRRTLEEWRQEYERRKKQQQRQREQQRNWQQEFYYDEYFYPHVPWRYQ